MTTIFLNHHLGRKQQEAADAFEERNRVLMARMDDSAVSTSLVQVLGWPGTGKTQLVLRMCGCVIPDVESSTQTSQIAACLPVSGEKCGLFIIEDCVTQRVNPAATTVVFMVNSQNPESAELLADAQGDILENQLVYVLLTRADVCSAENLKIAAKRVKELCEDLQQSYSVAWTTIDLKTPQNEDLETMNSILRASYLNGKFYKDFTAFDYWEAEFVDKWDDKEQNFADRLDEWLSARGCQQLASGESCSDFEIRLAVDESKSAEGTR